MSAILTQGLRKVYPLSAPKRRVPGSPPGAGAPGGSGAPGARVNGARELVALSGLDLDVGTGERAIG